MEDSGWIICHYKNEVDHKILGPLTTEQVQVGIQAGEWGYGDLIWKKGWLNWKRIRHCPEFQNSFTSQKKDSQVAFFSFED